MPFRHQMIEIRAHARRAAIAAWLCLAIASGSAAIVSADATPPAGNEATPVSAATVDDVTITLITWSHTADAGRFEAQIALSNHSSGPVSIASEVTLVTRGAQGGNATVALVASPGGDCAVAPGETLIVALSGDLAAGLTPERLVVGLVETGRSGARVEFPLNGDGASAFGGSGMPGGNAGEGTAAAGTAIASPAGATPMSSSSACGQH